MSLSSAKLQQLLLQTPVYQHIKTWWLAYSGGVDSRVLLHLLAPLKLNLRVVYIDHGLQVESAQWAEHCQNICAQYQLPFDVISVDVKQDHSQGLEAAARVVRYQAFENLMAEDDALLTAQHQNDQAETFLLQLFRGAGAAGLASMAVCNEFKKGWQLRPLLGFSRQQIIEFARREKLLWIEDPSNKNQRFDRNYLRHEVLPRLQQRWPSLTKTLSTAAQQQAENFQLLTELAKIDLEHCFEQQENDESLMMNIAQGNGLAIKYLAQLSEPRQRNCLRYWIAQQNYDLPPRHIHQQINQQVFKQRDGANIIITWSTVELRCYQGFMYILQQVVHSADQSFNWLPTDILNIPSLDKYLMAKKNIGVGICHGLLSETLQVKFRQGGERIKLEGQKNSRSVKKLFQQLNVPPWQRDRIPFLYYQENLVAVGDIIADEFIEKTEQAWLPVFQNLITT